MIFEQDKIGEHINQVFHPLSKRIITTPLVAFFSSVRCPGDIIIKTYDLARSVREQDATFLGGFQSPMEKEFLNIFLRGAGQTVVCPARGIGNMRIPALWKKPMANGRLMVLSFFDDNIRRSSKELAAKRNQYVAAMSDVIFVAHAEPGSKTEQLSKDALASGKPVLTLDSKDNDNLISLGAIPVTPEAAPRKISEVLSQMTR